MIPPLISLAGAPWDILPPGVHQATLAETKIMFATNIRRRELFDGLLIGVTSLRSAGCQRIFLDGSFVTGKPHPGDFDACWDPTGVVPGKLDAVFLDFTNGRAAQKALFEGEFFPSTFLNSVGGSTFLEFFQVERFTGQQKGILSISILADPFFLRGVTP